MMNHHACNPILLVAAALGACAESTTIPFDGAEAPWAWASRQLFLGATSPPPPSRCLDACVFASEDDGVDCDDDDGAPGSEFPMCAYCTDCVDYCPRVPSSPPPPPAGTPSGTGSPDAKYPNGELGTDGADYGPGQPLPPPVASPAPLRAGSGIRMKTCFDASDADFDGSGSGSEYPMPVMSTAVVGTHETRAIAGTHHAVMGTVRAGMGNVRAVVRMTRAFMGVNSAVVGIVCAVASTLSAGLGNINPVVSILRAVLGILRAVVDIRRTVKRTIRDFASTSRADIGTLSAVASTMPATGKRLASLGVESTGGIYVCDISPPAQPRFRDELNWRLSDLTCGETCFHASGGDGDDDVAGMENDLTCNLNEGPKSLVCIWAADSSLDLYGMFLAATPLAGGLTAYIIECGPVRGNDGSCPNTASCPYLSTEVGGSGLYRNPAGNSTIDPRAICHNAACIGAERISTTADGLRNGARKVFEIALEIALEELVIKGKIGDADVKYTFPYDQTNASEDTAGNPMEKAADLDGVPWKRLECADLALGLLRLASFVWAVCSSRRRSGPKERFANQTRHNQRFALAMLVLFVPRSSAMATTAPPDGTDAHRAAPPDGTDAHRAESVQTPPLRHRPTSAQTPTLRSPPLTQFCADDVNSGALDSSGAPLPCSYFSAQPSACASYSIARTTCPVACDTCPPPPPDPSGSMVVT